MKHKFNVETNSTSEYQFSILAEAMEVIQDFHKKTESYSNDEALCEICYTAIQQVIRLIETCNE